MRAASIATHRDLYIYETKKTKRLSVEKGHTYFLHFHFIHELCKSICAESRNEISQFKELTQHPQIPKTETTDSQIQYV